MLTDAHGRAHPTNKHTGAPMSARILPTGRVMRRLSTASQHNGERALVSLWELLLGSRIESVDPHIPPKGRALRKVAGSRPVSSDLGSPQSVLVCRTLLVDPFCCMPPSTLPLECLFVPSFCALPFHSQHNVRRDWIHSSSTPFRSQLSPSLVEHPRRVGWGEVRMSRYASRTAVQLQEFCVDDAPLARRYARPGSDPESMWVFRPSRPSFRPRTPSCDSRRGIVAHPAAR